MSTVMSTKDEITVFATGRDIDALVLTLIENADDKNNRVTESFADSLTTIGYKQPELVISSACNYLLRNSKLSVSHRTFLLVVIQRILSRVDVLKLDVNLVNRLIKLSVSEMTASKDVIPEWQTASSDVLVALARTKCVEVIADLLTKFQPGQLPHLFVVETLGKLAVVNPFNMVQHLNALLPSFLPLLGLAKNDSIRWAFCAALTRFAESVLEYVANLDRAPDKTVRRTTFSADVYAAYDVLMSSWLSAARDAKLQMAVIECIGMLAHLLSHEKLDEQCARLTNQLVGLLKKYPDAPRVAQALANVLEACAEARTAQLDTQLEPLCTALLSYLTVTPDFANQNAVKFHNELLRSFTILCHVNVSRVVTFLLQRLEQTNVQQRLKVLIVLRHIVNYAQTTALTATASEETPVASTPKLIVTLGNDEKHRIIGSFRALFTDPQTYVAGSNKLRKLAAHCVIAFADHDFMHLEGSRYLVEFIVRQCATVDECERSRKDTDDSVPNAEIKALADNILHSFSSRLAPQMLPVLWPFLLDFFCTEPYTLAMPALCKALVHLNRPSSAENQPDDDDQQPDDDDGVDNLQSLDTPTSTSTSASSRVSLFAEIDYEMHANVPRPAMLMARLFSLLGAGSCGLSSLPFGGPAWRTQSEQTLLAINSLAYVLHPDLVALFQTVIPKLVRFLHSSDTSGSRPRSTTSSGTGSGESRTDERVWTDLVLKMLAKAVEIVNNEQWTAQLGDALLTHVTSLYAKPVYTAEKCFAMRCVGVLLRAANSREFVTRALDTVFGATLHANRAERDACATCVGYCAAAINNMDLVLHKLELWIKQDVKKTSVLSLLTTDKNSPEQSLQRCTAVLCYGYVVQYAPRTITSRVDTNVVAALNPLLHSAKDSTLKESLVRSIGKIAVTMQQAGALAVSSSISYASPPPPSASDTPTFSRRLDLVHNILVFLNGDVRSATYHEFKMEIVSALRALALCDPFLPDGDLETLLKTTLDCLMQTVMAATSGKQASAGINILAKNDDSSSAELQLKAAELTEAYSGLLCALMLKHVSCFAQILSVLRVYIASTNEPERRVALQTLGTCLRELERQNVPDMLAAQTSKWAFQEFGPLVGTLAPRCADPSLAVRDAACGALLSTYNIMYSMTLRSGSEQRATDDCVAMMNIVREKLQKLDANIMFSAVNDLGNKVICKRTPSHHLVPLADTLIDALLDDQSHSAAAACVLLNCMFKQLAAELAGHLEKLLMRVHDSLARLHAITDAARLAETEKIRVGAYRALRTLSTKFLVPVVQFLLKQPLPYDEVWIETLSTLARDSTLAAAMFDFLLDALSRAQPFEEQPTAGRKSIVRPVEQRKVTPDRDFDENEVPTDFWLELPARRTTWTYLAHLTALKLMLTAEETEAHVCGVYFERLLITSLLAVASCVGTDKPKTAQPEAVPAVTNTQADKTPLKTAADKAKEKEKEKEKFRLFKKNDTNSADKLEPFEVAYELFEKFATRAKLVVLSESVTLSQSPVSAEELQAHLLLHSKALSSELLGSDMRGRLQKLNAIVISQKQLEPGCDALVEAGSFIDVFSQLLLLVLQCVSLPNCLQTAASFYAEKKDKSRLEYASLFGYYARAVQCVQSFVHSPFVLYRFTACCLFAQLCGRVRSRSELNWLNQALIAPLLSMLEERHVFVRQLVVRGFANLAVLRDNRLRERAFTNTAILTALLTVLDSHDDLPSVTLTVEACEALLQILERLRFAQVRFVLMNLAVKVRACFEQPSSRVRAASIRLFAAIGAFAQERDAESHAEEAEELEQEQAGRSKRDNQLDVAEFRTQFIEQIQNNFVTLVLRLNEVNGQVARACKHALRQLAPLLISQRLSELITGGLTLDATLHYGEFLNDLSKLLVLDCADRVGQFVMNCVQQFRNTSPRIRGNAALLCGFLLGAYLTLLQHFNIQAGASPFARASPDGTGETQQAVAVAVSSQFVFGSGLFRLPEGDKLALLKERLAVVNITRSHIAGALMLLIKEDKNADVRMKAAEAISYLHAL